MNPFLFMPEALPGCKHHLDRYRHFIWSRLFRVLPEDTKIIRHHIVPKSFGMNKDFKSQPWNIIALTDREHFFAHMMLWRAFQNQMFFTFNLMSNKGLDTGYIISSKAYQDLMNQRVPPMLRKNHTEESKQKMRDYKKTDEHRKNIGLAGLGRHHSEDTKKRLSEAFSGDKNPCFGRSGPLHPLYGKRGEDCHNYGKKHTDEVKKAISVRQTGDQNHFYGKKHSEETKEKIRLAAKNRKKQSEVAGLGISKD